MSRPRVLDLFCGAGGSAEGLHRAGFDIKLGIDISTQPNYPFRFSERDAIGFLEKINAIINVWNKNPMIDFIWASPPCQAYSWASQRWRNVGYEYDNLVDITRELLEETGVPYVIENVPGAPLQDPIRLCGEMFDLRVVRHRHFESNLDLEAPEHQTHKSRIERPARDGTDRMVERSWYCTVSGHGGESYSYKLEDWQEAMGIDWMTKEELVEAIPPAYSEYIGNQILEQLNG